jgi:hypothetical protein
MQKGYGKDHAAIPISADSGRLGISELRCLVFSLFIRLYSSGTVGNRNGLWHSGSQAVRRRVQTLPQGCTCGQKGVSLSVDYGFLPALRRIAPLSALRGVSGQASSTGDQASQGGVILWIFFGAASQDSRRARVRLSDRNRPQSRSGSASAATSIDSHLSRKVRGEGGVPRPGCENPPPSTTLGRP